MLETDRSNIVINDLGTKKVGHLYENIKFDCNDNVEKIVENFCYGYFDIIGNAQYGNFDMLNKLINNTFNDDIKVLEKTLKDSENISPDAKKKFFFNEEEGKIIGDFRNYIKILYMERVLFDILNIGLKDLENNSIKEILQSKQEARINNFINSMTDDKNNNGMFGSNFETNFSKLVQDKKNFLRYVIYFYYLKKNLMNIEEEMKKLKEYCDTEAKISKNNELIQQKENELKNLEKKINQLNNNIEKRQKELNNPSCLQRNTYESEQKSDKQDLEQKQDEKVQLEQELQRLKNVNFISNGYGNELKLAKNVLEDIQNSWKNVFESFIFHYMLEYPNTISQLREDYSFSMWEFVEFLSANIGHQNFNHALYEIDKTKKLKDFQGDEDKKRNSVLDKFKANINNLNENQRKFLNDLFHNKYDDGLENSWMRKASWILFSGSSLFVVIAMAPLLAIIIPDVLMGVCALFAFIIGVFLAICIVCSVCSGANVGNELGGILGFLLYGCWVNMPWITFKDIPIIPYYCSAFFPFAIGITTVILIGAVTFYMYKKNQFKSIIKVPNLQQQQIEKSPLEKQLDDFKNRSEKTKELMPSVNGKNLSAQEPINN